VGRIALLFGLWLSPILHSQVHRTPHLGPTSSPEMYRDEEGLGVAKPTVNTVDAAT